MQDVLREGLVTAVKQLEGSAIRDPVEVAARQNTLASPYSAWANMTWPWRFWRRPGNAEVQLRPDYPDTLTIMENLGVGYRYAGNWTACRSWKRHLPCGSPARPHHPTPSLAWGPWREATWPPGSQTRPSAFRRDLALRKSKLGPDHPETLTSMHNLAEGYQAAGKLDSPAALWRRRWP